MGKKRITSEDVYSDKLSKLYFYLWDICGGLISSDEDVKRLILVLNKLTRRYRKILKHQEIVCQGDR